MTRRDEVNQRGKSAREMRSCEARVQVRLWSELRSQSRLAQSRLKLHFQGGFVPSTRTGDQFLPGPQVSTK